MEVEIRLFASFAKYLPPGSERKRARIEVEEGAKVGELMDKLNIPPKITNVIMVNGEHRNQETKLSEGDRVSVIPPISGG